jgi:hypothetical protein
MGDQNRRVGVAVFTAGAFLMAVGSLLPWFLFPLYIRYGWTKDFLEHVWPQTLVGNTPLVVLAWILTLPLGVMFAVLGGLIYARRGMREA